MHHGCAICSPAKSSMAVNAEHGIEAFSLAKQGSRLLGTMMDRLEEDIHKGDLQRYHPQWTKDASLLSKALGALLNEIRKFEESASTDVREYTFDDRIETLLAWCDTLPPSKQEALLKTLNTHLRLSLAND